MEIEEASGGPAQSAALREHLGACAPCEQFRRERASLRRLVGGLERVAAPADFEFRLRARMAAAEGARRAKPFRFGFVPGVASVALAVCFVSVSAWIYLKREPAPNRPDAPTLASSVAPAAAPGSGMTKDTASNVSAENPSKGGDELASSSTPQRVFKLRGASTFRARLDGKGIGRAERGAGSAATFDSRPAPILKASSHTPGEVASLPTTTVALRTAAVPLQIVLRDESGAARVVPMSSVSFGSQELVRQGRGSMPVSYAVTEGVW
jgi:hypothetical protein